MYRLLLIFVSLIITPVALWAAGVEDSVRAAMKELQIARGSASLCVLSNAFYVDAPITDVLTEITGCTIGKENMFFIQFK